MTKTLVHGNADDSAFGPESCSMKTLLLSEIFPPMTGGSGRWFWEIYSHLSREQVAIVAGNVVGAEAFDVMHNLDVTRLPLTFADWGLASWCGLSDYWRAFRAVRQIVKSRGIEHIHCGRCLPEGLIALMVNKLDGIPFSCYVHGEDANAVSLGAADGVLSSRQLRWMTRQVMISTSAVIANSRNSARIASGQWGLPAERVKLLHPGCDTNYFVPAARDATVRKSLGWGDRPVLLTVGRLQKRKGHDMVIRALSQVREAIPDVLFAIVGGGEELEPLKQLVVSERQQDHVLFHGKLADEQLRQAYQQADLFVLANRQIGTDIEGFGMVLLEAQACGRPVLAGDSGGTAETMSLGETGEVVNCDQPDELALRMIRLLLNRDELEQRGVAARSWVIEHFDWTALRQQAAEMFGLTNVCKPDEVSHQTMRNEHDNDLRLATTS